MPSVEKQVRVFISSTFRDMHAERDHLVTVVFPELRERVEQLGLEFFDVDLRWGVPAKDANGETANSWEYCRQWIDRVEPFFVCILGQRYGWVPEPHHFRESVDRQRQEREPRSITDLEVRHAVLDSRRKRRSYFYMRATPVPTPTELAGEFVDPPEFQDRLDQLKTTVRQCGRPARDYRCRWTGQGFAEMEEFGRFVLGDLWSGVLRDERYVSKDVWRQVLGADPDSDLRYTDESQPVPRELWEKIVAKARPAPVSLLDAEREQMDAFAVSRLKWFQGRAIELETLTDFISSNDERAARLAVVAALPGQGKSALLAKLHEKLKSSSHFVITHFVGATERSATAQALVERLLGELDRSGIAWPVNEQKEGEELKRDFTSLCVRLAKRLGDYTGERRIVILLDALNQLTDGHHLVWLAHRLGKSVRVVVSCVEDAAAKLDSPEARVLHALASRQPAPLRVPLGPLTENDVRTIVVEYLKEYCKELDREHVDAICRLEQARNPLYLLVMLGELRTLGGNDMNHIVGERIATLALDYPDIVNLFRWVLQRLEVFGAEAVQWWCLYLAHGRVGMTSHELADLLARKLGADTAATALRIERGLRRYLLRRGGQLDFFHSQLRQAVLQKYGQQTKSIAVRENIANYFEAQSFWLDSAEEQQRRIMATPQKPRTANVRKVTELPWQLTSSLALTILRGENSETQHIRPALTKLLTDFEFIEAKCSAALSFALLEDYARLLELVGLDDETRKLAQDFYMFVKRHRHILDAYPQLSVQQAVNEPSSSAASKLAAIQAPERRHPPRLLRWLNKPDDSSGLQLTLVGHQSPIRCCACSPDGRRIVSGAGDAQLLVWDILTGEKLFSLNGHQDEVRDCCFSSTGALIASASRDGTVRLWDAACGAALAVLKCNGEAVYSCSFSHDERLVVTAGQDQVIRVWSVHEQEVLAAWSNLTRGKLCCTFTDDGESVLVVSGPGMVQLRKIASERETWSGEVFPKEDGFWLKTLSVRKGGWVLLAGQTDSFCGRNVAVYRLGPTASHEGWSLQCSHRHEAVAAWYDDVRVVIADGKSLQVRQMKESNEGGFLWLDWESVAEVEQDETTDVTAVCASSKGLIVTGNESGTLHVWDLPANVANPKSLRQVRHAGNVTMCRFLAGSRIVTGDTKTEEHSEDGWYPSADVFLWNEEGNVIKYFRGGNYVRYKGNRRDKVLSPTDFGHAASISDCVSVDDNTFVTASEDGCINVWRGETYARSLHGSRCVVVDERRIAAWGTDGRIRVYEVDSGLCLRDIAVADNRLTDVLVFAKSMLIARTRDSIVAVCNPTDGRVSILNLAPIEVIWWVDDRSKRLILGCSDSSIRSWVPNPDGLEQNQPELLVRSSSSTDGTGLMLPNGTLVLLDPPLLRMVNMENLAGASLFARLGDTASSLVVAQSGDGWTIVTAGDSDDHLSKLWRFNPLSLEAVFFLSTKVTAAALDRPGRRIVLGDAKGHVFFLKLED